MILYVSMAIIGVFSIALSFPLVYEPFSSFSIFLSNASDSSLMMRDLMMRVRHFTGQAIFTSEVIDSATGQVVGRVTNPGTFIVNAGGLPTIQTMQQEIACIGSGSVSPIHFVFVIDGQGNFHVHP
jgi:hypothetical protein